MNLLKAQLQAQAMLMDKALVLMERADKYNQQAQKVSSPLEAARLRAMSVSHYNQSADMSARAVKLGDLDL